MDAMSAAAPAPREALCVRDLTVRVRATGTVCLDAVTLEARRGEAIAIVGDSGAGKSTLALALMGLLPSSLERAPESVLHLGPTALHALDETGWRMVRGRRLAMVFQEPLLALDPAMRVGRQMIEAGMAHGLSAAEAEDRSLARFAQLELPAPARLATRFPHELSGGMRQRVLLAMAMLHGPEVLIADEATTALDPALRRSVLATLDTLRREVGTTVLLISHDHTEVAARADRIVTMASGRIVDEGAASSRGRPRPTTLSAEGAREAPRERPRGGSLLQIHDLTVDYAQGSVLRERASVTRAVDSVAFTIDRGEVLGVVGPSGSGKSSVARAILRLIPVAGGSIHLDGTDLLALEGGALRRMRRRLQGIPQDAGAALTPHLRTEALVAEGLEIHGLAHGDEARVRARALLDEVGLPRRAATARPGELSTGERQRVAIARALATAPELLLCDEPVANLDPERRERILDLLGDLRRDRGLAILLISHDASAIERLASRVISMYLGRSGAPDAS